MKAKGIVITPEQFLAQWADKPHRFQLNVHNFEVRLWKAGVSVFKQSFDLQRFNTNGSVPWRRGNRNNSAGNPRGSLMESGLLKKSIVGTVEKGATADIVKIYTDPTMFSRALRHPGFCYAAIHNSPDSEGLRTGRVATMPQRQFMPTKEQDSSVFNERLNKIEKVIFETFPQ